MSYPAVSVAFLGETCPRAMSITSVVRRTARLLKEVAKDDEPPCDEGRHNSTAITLGVPNKQIVCICFL